MTAPNHLAGKVFAVLAGTIALYALLAVLTGWEDFRDQLAAFSLRYIPLLVLLSGINYSLRFARWEIYLSTLDISLSRRESLVLFFATFLMVITPGKVGEAFKAGLLRERHQVPLATGLPVLLAERLFDFLAIFVLACIGMIFWRGPVGGLTAGIVGAALVPVFLVVFRSRKVRRFLLERAGRSRYLKRYQLGLEESLHALTRLLSVRLTFWSLLLSTLAWAAECVSLWVVCLGSGAAVRLIDSVFIYAAATLVGSVTFLPGGLGGTEVTLVGLLKSLQVSDGSAVSAALIVRVATLWLAVAIGFVFLAVGRRHILSTPDSSKSAA